ncbi:MAG: SLBB domain-containing protein [Candidatus Delongbacteria bacterium]|nr:SLBB domain-containing protein [Candidatus Delongbacteria bacterium]
MKRFICVFVILCSQIFALYSQDAAGPEANILDAVKTNGLSSPDIQSIDMNSQVEKNQQMLLEQLKESELLDKKADQIQNEKELKESDDDDEKIVNIRSTDFLREITLSTKGFYGYDLFYTSRGFKLESSMTAYSDYQVGPGDEIVIAMWGDVEMRNTLKVSNEGTVYLNNVGLVSVNGLRLNELETKLKKLLSKAYITLDPPRGEASTYLDVSMGKLRPITVFLVGEVFKKGAIKLDSYSTVFTALYNAGGPTAKGSLRDIHVVRDGKIVSTIDIYDYLLTGNKVNDIILKNNDNILVPPRHSSVKLEGEVNNESIYELKKEETMVDLMKFSGGLRTTATIDRFQVERIVPFEKRTEDIMHSKEVLEFKLGSVKNGGVEIEPVRLRDGDIVTVFPISNILINYVNISGAVLLPGKYALEKDMTLGDLLNQTGGVLPEAYLKKIHLTRIYPDLTTKLFDLDLNDPESMNFKLESSDRIKIFSIWELITKNNVTISGHVKNVGTVNLDGDSKISDLILMAGGLEDEAFRKQTYLERADLIRYNDDGITTRIIPVNLRKVLEGDKSEDIVLRDKDHLKVYGVDITIFPSHVSVKGMVKNPGTFDLQTNMRVEDLILQAGGFKKGAYLYEAEVFRIDPYNVKPDALISVHKMKLNSDNFKTSGFGSKDQFLLQDMDLVVIRKHPDYQIQRTVELNGEVRFPGVYSLQKEKETLAELIERAGGLKDEAFTQGISFIRDSIAVLSDFQRVSKNSTGGKLVLKHGDIITVPKHPGTVLVEGFVYSPGLVNYDKSWSLNRYVEAAGGVMVEDDYEKGEVVVFRPGGAAEVDGWFFSPTVKEGSRIVVKKVRKPEEKEGTSLRDWVAIIGSIVTISYYLSR